MGTRTNVIGPEPAPLAEYRAKRHFDRTREPAGAVHAASRQGGVFVVQKHKARRLHFDFRLELDGVLKSWAVPKGPSLDPSQKRLAVRTEDHPIEYARFEGTIPDGEYGAGAVMLWDEGTWIPRGDPHIGLERGELKFNIDGERLKGGFVLVRLAGRVKQKRENWILIKERDEDAAVMEPSNKWRRSVATGRTFEEIANGAEEWSSKRPLAETYRRRTTKRRIATFPKFRPPQLATLAEGPPSGPAWVHEIKLDGYRVIAAVGGGRARIYTRSGLDWTDKFPVLSKDLAGLEVGSALIDGEVVVLDEKGRSDFARLQGALKTGDDVIRLYAFDLLELDGRDMTGLNLLERKNQLASALKGAPDTVIFNEHISGEGAAVLSSACRLGLEGLVSKQVDSVYVSRRTSAWIKTKCSGREEFVIGGWRPSVKKGRAFASLLIGEFDEGRLYYKGRVGAGFDRQSLEEIFQKLIALTQARSPFADVPRAIARSASWVAPRLVAEISYTERTEEGYLRHPVFLGLREDKKAEEVQTPNVIRSRSALTSARTTEPPSMSLSHPDKLMYPEEGVTKADVAAHWRRVAKLALPHIRGRPLSLVRCPDGASAACFFQRHHLESMPEGLRPFEIADNKGERENYIVIEAEEGLEAAAQIAALELHLWGARASTVECPDRLVLDLDPDPSVPFAELKRAAHDLRALLEAADLKSFVMLSGGKGLHIVAPLAPVLRWREVNDFARGLATRLAADDPARFVAVMTKAKRKGRIFIDYLRNERSASAVAPYSPRTRPRSSVATPLNWSELKDVTKSDAYTIAAMQRRIAALKGKDPWEGYFNLEQRISRAALKMFSSPK